MRSYEVILDVYRMLKVRNLMVKDVVTAKEEMTFEKAVEVLCKRHIGSIVIINDRRKCTGIFTERDAIRVTAQKIPPNTPLKEIMTRNVVTIKEDATFEEAKKHIISHRIRHLPVTDEEGKIVGMFAIRAVLADLFGLGS